MNHDEWCWEWEQGLTNLEFKLFFNLKLWGCYHKDVNRNEEERDQPTRTGGRSMEQLLEALRKPSAYSHPTGPIEVAETHISWVFLAGNYASKSKTGQPGVS